MDGVLAGINVAGAVVNGVLAGQQYGQEQEASTIAAGINGGVAALLLISAITGAAKTSTCQEMLALADENEANARRAADAAANLRARTALQEATRVPPPPPRKLAPMQCFADVDCGSERMCELGQCMPLRVSP